LNLQLLLDGIVDAVAFQDYDILSKYKILRYLLVKDAEII
jgi:hypothetical protein